MKRFLAATSILILSVSVFASTISKDKLKKINDTIILLMSEDQRANASIKVSSATIDDVSGLLTSIVVNTKIYGETLSVDLMAKFEGEEIKLKAMIEANAAKFELTYDDLMRYAADAKKYVDNINEKGDYTATLIIVDSKIATSVKVELLPARKGQDLSIKKLMISATVPKDTAKENVKIVISGTFKATVDNVKNAQISLTNIVNDLANGKKPSDEDFEVLGKIIREALSAID